MECIGDQDYLFIQLKNNKASLPVELWESCTSSKLAPCLLLQHCAPSLVLFVVT